MWQSRPTKGTNNKYKLGASSEFLNRVFTVTCVKTIRKKTIVLRYLKPYIFHVNMTLNNTTSYNKYKTYIWSLQKKKFKKNS